MIDSFGPGITQVADVLSAYPQCDAIRGAIKRLTGRDWPDVPVLIDKWCPRGMAVVGPDVVIVNRPGEVIDRVQVIDASMYKAIVADAASRLP